MDSVSLASPILLPPPKMSGGMALLEALSRRQSSRSFSPRPLDPAALSGLLWAAFGINRPATRGRTAPSARNWQEIEVYVAMPEGLYLYEAVPHRLSPVLNRDVRRLAGAQDFVGVAPLNLVYVADLARIDAANDDERRFYTAADAGFIAQNVYLYCAAAGLAAVVRGLIDRTAFAETVPLRRTQRVVLAQTVGYPA